jgi:hypothetical protein
MVSRSTGRWRSCSPPIAASKLSRFHESALRLTGGLVLNALIPALHLAIPVSVFFLVYGPFEFLDGKISEEAREGLADFLKGHRYETYLGVLPALTQGAFDQVFGPRHFSAKCIKASIALSLAALIFVFVFPILFSFNVFPALATGIEALLEKGRESPNDGIRQAAERLTNIPAYGLLGIGVLLWICWCLIPDYLSLLKARIVLVVIRFTNPGPISLLITLLIDFVVGVWAFVASFTLLQAIVAAYLIQTPAGGGPPVLLGFVVWVLIFSIEAYTMYATKILFVLGPVASLFWASLLPSVWLWGHIIAALLTRALLASRPLLRGSVSFLDIEDHPVRSVGIVAGLIAGVLTSLTLLVFAII